MKTGEFLEVLKEYAAKLDELRAAPDSAPDAEVQALAQVLYEHMDPPWIMDCPTCHERFNVEAGRVDAERGIAWQEVRCLRCGTVYREVYLYDHTELVEGGSGAA